MVVHKWIHTLKDIYNRFAQVYLKKNQRIWENLKNQGMIRPLRIGKRFFEEFWMIFKALPASVLVEQNDKGSIRIKMLDIGQPHTA